MLIADYVFNGFNVSNMQVAMILAVKPQIVENDGNMALAALMRYKSPCSTSHLVARAFTLINAQKVVLFALLSSYHPIFILPILVLSTRMNCVREPV